MIILIRLPAYKLDPFTLTKQRIVANTDIIQLRTCISNQIFFSWLFCGIVIEYVHGVFKYVIKTAIFDDFNLI